MRVFPFKTEINVRYQRCINIREDSVLKNADAILVTLSLHIVFYRNNARLVVCLMFTPLIKHVSYQFNAVKIVGYFSSRFIVDTNYKCRQP